MLLLLDERKEQTLRNNLGSTPPRLQSDPPEQSRQRPSKFPRKQQRLSVGLSRSDTSADASAGSGSGTERAASADEAMP